MQKSACVQVVRMASSSMAACPECGTQVAERNLAQHRRRLHPSPTDRLARSKRAIFLGTVVLAVVVIGYWAIASAPSPEAAHDLQARWVGRDAPDFTLHATDGTTFKLSNFRGKSNVLLFFNEGLMCNPCVKQMADMDKDAQRFKDLNVAEAVITTDSLPRLTDWAKSASVANEKVVSDQSMDVDRTYEMLSKDVSMMPGTGAGHSYLLVSTTGKVLWRADYGPGIMYVQQDAIYAKVKAALS